MEIPEAAIWNRAELGQVLEDVVRSPAQVVYSLVPSEKNHFSGASQTFDQITHDCRTMQKYSFRVIAHTTKLHTWTLYCSGKSSETTLCRQLLYITQSIRLPTVLSTVR